MKFLYTLIILFFLGCQSMNVKENDFLDENEGYLLFHIEATALKWELSLFNNQNINSVFGMASAVFHIDSDKNKYILIKLKEGTYAAKYIYNKPFAFELTPYFFDIKPGVINYIGKLNINVLDDDPYFPRFNYYYNYKINDALKFINNNYPSIENKYELNNDSVIISPLFLEPKQLM